LSGNSGGKGNGGNNGSNTTAPAGIFSGLAPEEIVLVASLFAIALASDLSDADATSLAFFLSTISSNIGLYIDKRSRETISQIPGIPGLG
jgi:hypothetical protein